jgi:hypothetical protein
VSKARGESRVRTRAVRVCLVAATAAACAVALSLPAGASASTVTCSGRLAPDTDSGIPVSNALDYSVKCDEDFSAFSMVYSKTIDYFSPAPDIFAGSEPAGDDSMSCEGDFPGQGFGCHGTVGAGHTVKGIVATEGRYCPRAKRRHHHARRHRHGVRSWVTVTTTQLDKDGNPFTTSSQPFAISGPRCGAKHRHRSHA